MISRDDVLHIARLARVELAEAELSKFEKDLSGILTFVEKLNEVATDSIEPLTGGTDLKNILREDDPSRDFEAVAGDQLIKAAPRKREGYVEVPSVFDRSI